MPPGVLPHWQGHLPGGDLGKIKNCYCQKIGNSAICVEVICWLKGSVFWPRSLVNSWQMPFCLPIGRGNAHGLGVVTVSNIAKLNMNTSLAMGGKSLYLANEGRGKIMLVAVILFSLKDEVKATMDQEAVKAHLAHLVEEYKKVPGLKEKTFFMNPENIDQGAVLIWESREHLAEYLKSDLYKAAVTDICEGEPRLETYLVTATLEDGVLL